MTTSQAILEQLDALPDDAQREVLDFVAALARRAGEAESEASEWSELSLAAALAGMEDEDSPYTLVDLRLV